MILVCFFFLLRGVVVWCCVFLVLRLYALEFVGEDGKSVFVCPFFFHFVDGVFCKGC
jgi:hypothetical protein